MVILKTSSTDAAVQRRVIEQVQGRSVVVVEVSDVQPHALVRRAPAEVDVVEIGPGFLVPFLLASVAKGKPASL